MHFGTYLVERGVIDANDFYRAFKAQLASRPQLGMLAMNHRLLTISQVFKVLAAQCDQPSVLFGDLAVQLGFMTSEDVTRLLREQSTLMTRFDDVLVDLGVLSRKEVEGYYSDYMAAMETAMNAEMVMIPA